MAPMLDLLTFDSLRGAFGVRVMWLAAAVIQLGLGLPAWSQDSSATANRAISEKLPLFAKNHCETHKNSANQLFCAEPALAAAGAKLATAIEERLNRLADRGPAIEENAQWIRDRNQSCGIFGNTPVRAENIDTIVGCLKLETEERVAILRDPNFDCLAANTAASALICSEPELADDESELNSLVRSLIGKLKDDEAKNATAEYARWIRDRDRRCRLADKDNAPLSELASLEDCLENYMKEMTAGMLAAKGDPRRVFLRPLDASRPNADAVDLCITRIHAASSCGDFMRVRRVYEIDNQVADRSALVTAGIEMVVLSPFAACSQVASNCTGACWDLRAGKPGKPQLGNRDSLAVTQRIRIQKSFKFSKTENNRWRCEAPALQPVDFGITLGSH
jgi:uncharacterized protein YecT (DUF1311 family)